VALPRRKELPPRSALLWWSALPARLRAAVSPLTSPSNPAPAPGTTRRLLATSRGSTAPPARPAGGRGRRRTAAGARPRPPLRGPAARRARPPPPRPTPAPPSWFLNPDAWGPALRACLCRPGRRGTRCPARQARQARRSPPTPRRTLPSTRRAPHAEPASRNHAGTRGPPEGAGSRGPCRPRAAARDRGRSPNPRIPTPPCKSRRSRSSRPFPRACGRGHGRQRRRVSSARPGCNFAPSKSCQHTATRAPGADPGRPRGHGSPLSPIRPHADRSAHQPRAPSLPPPRAVTEVGHAAPGCAWRPRAGPVPLVEVRSTADRLGRGAPDGPGAVPTTGTPTRGSGAGRFRGRRAPRSAGLLSADGVPPRARGRSRLHGTAGTSAGQGRSAARSARHPQPLATLRQ